MAIKYNMEFYTHITIPKTPFTFSYTVQTVLYNPQNEMFRLLGTKRSFSQNETFFFSHPYPLYPALFRLISHF